MTGTMLDVKEMRHELMRTYINVSLALQIKTMRESRGWTQTELAQHVGCFPNQISNIELVRWKEWPTLTTLHKIAAAFDVALEVRFGSWTEQLAEFLSPADLNVKSFTEEYADIESALGVAPPTPAAVPTQHAGGNGESEQIEAGDEGAQQ